VFVPGDILPARSGRCVAVRAEGLAVRVMLRAASEHESAVFRGFEPGAGDYLVTPFCSLELGLRLNRLLAA
jgi:DNA-binding response OmpR family regulator